MLNVDGINQREYDDAVTQYKEIPLDTFFKKIKGKQRMLINFNANLLLQML